jgi:hypothetical protein
LADSDDVQHMTADSPIPVVHPDSRLRAPGLEAALAEEARAVLLALSQNFDGKALENRRLIRDLAEQDWHLFYSAAIEILKNRHDSHCGLYLVKLLIGRNLLIDALCDPALSQEQALAIARVASRIDSTTDINLAKFLADREASNEAVRPAELMRLMEIMVEISNFVRILPALKRMSRHPDAHVRSKAVLMIGRGNPASSWLQNRFAESDPRIRANTVEALWGVDTADARVCSLPPPGTTTTASRETRCLLYTAWEKPPPSLICGKWRRASPPRSAPHPPGPWAKSPIRGSPASWPA